MRTSKGIDWIFRFVVLFVGMCSCTSALSADDDESGLLEQSRLVFGIGVGRGNTDVNRQGEDEPLEGFINESGISLNLRLSSELPFHEAFALQAGFDMYSSAGFSSLFSSKASYAALVGAGIVIGKIAKPGQPFLSLSYGAGVVSLSDQGPETGCIICSGERGGTATGPAFRVALGFNSKLGSRLALVWMQTGGSGGDDFPDDVEARLNTVLLVLSGVRI